MRYLLPRLRAVFAVLGVTALGACISSSVPPQVSVPATEAKAPSYDWRALILVPFGTLLKEVPLALHEVLLFHDAAHAALATEDKECYAIDGASPPQVLGRRPDDYLLCFDHDRLTRVEASVGLPADSAEQAFAALCAQWRGNGPPAAPTTCNGRDGDTGFSARLGAQSAESMIPMSISLFSVAP